MPERISHHPRRWPVFLGALVAIVFLLAGCATIPPPSAALNFAKRAPAAGVDRTKFNLSVYNNVWQWVESRYYDPNFDGVDWRAAGERHRSEAAEAKNDVELYAAINALLGELNDPHTRAESAPEFVRTFWQRNIGLGWRSVPVPNATDGRRRVTEVFPKDPAAEAGVRVGWIWLAADGRPPAEMTSRGGLKDGQTVRCDFLTELGESRTLGITAREIAVPSYRTVREVAAGIFVLRFDRFDLETAHWLRDEVKAHAAAKGLIFDVRHNGGGNLFALGSILGDIFPEAIDMGRMVHRGDAALWQRVISQRGGPRYAGKVAVLVSQNSASAAEIFAELVQENRRGEVVGQKSRGAVLTVVFWPLAAGGKLWLSVYDYRSPAGIRLEQRGVWPDIPVPADDNATEDEDPVVKAAVLAFDRRTPAMPAISARK